LESNFFKQTVILKLALFGEQLSSLLAEERRLDATKSVLFCNKLLMKALQAKS